MNQHELKKAFADGSRVYGTMISSPSPRWVPEVAKTGLDFVFVDTEHMPIDRSTMCWMCQAYKGAGIAPIVRISSPDAYEACRALDAGAAGIVSPYLETVEEVKRLVGAVKYRPLKGQKLRDVLDGKTELSPKEKDYLAGFNNGNLVVLNIESKLAVERLDELLSVPGVDAVFIGPHDLSINLGIPEEYNNPLFEEYVERIITTCRKHKVGVANHFSLDINKQLNWLQKGMNICLWNVDYIRLVQVMQQDISLIKKQMGDTAGRTGSADAV